MNFVNIHTVIRGQKYHDPCRASAVFKPEAHVWSSNRASARASMVVSQLIGTL